MASPEINEYNDRKNYNTSYINYINSFNERYLKTLNSLPDFTSKKICIGNKKIPFNKKTIIKFSSKFIELVDKTLCSYNKKGNIQAYKTLLNLINNSTKIDSIPLELFMITSSVYRYQYRLRKETSILKKPINLFHMPFEDKAKVKSYRYSIQEHPSLYTSNSIYIACKECNLKDDFSNIYAVKLELQNNVFRPAIDLRYIFNNPTKKELFMFLIRWPLIFACSLKVRDNSINLPKEYILPQMVYQWVNNKFKVKSGGVKNNILGVIYNSSKVKYNKDLDFQYAYNLAAPVQEIKNTGHCDTLKQSFKVSKPILLTEIKKDNIKTTNTVGKVNTSKIYENGEFKKYEDTIYSKFELYLYEQETYDL